MAGRSRTATHLTWINTGCISPASPWGLLGNPSKMVIPLEVQQEWATVRLPMALRVEEDSDGLFHAIKSRLQVLAHPFSRAHRHTGTSFTFKTYLFWHLMAKFHFYYLVSVKGPRSPYAQSLEQRPAVAPHPEPLPTFHYDSHWTKGLSNFTANIKTRCSGSREEGV